MQIQPEIPVRDPNLYSPKWRIGQDGPVGEASHALFFGLAKTRRILTDRKSQLPASGTPRHTFLKSLHILGRDRGINPKTAAKWRKREIVKDRQDGAERAAIYCSLRCK
jgi:hypothetical protein